MDKNLGKITEAILSSYHLGGGMNNIDGSNMPSKRAVASICEDLLQLVFPGFHDQEPIHSTHLARVTSHRIYSVSDRLNEELFKCLRLREPSCPNATAEKLLYAFLESIPAVRELLRTDIRPRSQAIPLLPTWTKLFSRIPS